MKNYVNYLLSKPKILAWVIGVITFFSVVVTTIIIDWDMMLDNPTWLLIGLAILLPSILFVAMYQPYYEWKDGIKKAKQQEDYKNSLGKK